MSKLLSMPLTLPCGSVITNRLAKSATQEGLADPHGHASEELCTLYRRWSLGGAGLLITGDVMVDACHLERPGNVVVANELGVDKLARWSAAARAAGNHVWMQINHPGRQTPIRFNPSPLAPSATQDGIPPRAFGFPRAMSEANILDVIQRFAFVAKMARETGFTGVQLHAAHGFLISQFLSPLANKRTDNWGGSLDNRARLLIECISAVRTAVGEDFPVSIKLNSADFQRGGFDLAQSVRVVKMLNDTSLDLIEISGGNAASPVMLGGSNAAAHPKAASTIRRGVYFAEYARNVRPITHIPIMITGGFRARDVMEDAISAGITDLIGMARPFCVLPDFCAQLLRSEISSIPAVENSLLLDRSKFGCDVDDTAFNHITSYSQLAWLYIQVARLANNQAADLGLDIELATNTLAVLENARESARLAAANEDL